ncbi:hypothetical protein P0136_04910 [Lentisphaerota bacterium ZTH]|nr:hypothetical protein JYG24_03970 [Lentisphaerota bacterium]WET07330.1 hypothetical protein P0136_04910 [Lentisphaerota bacterium ZTH]
MLKIAKVLVVTFLLSVTLAGCIFAPYHKTAYYDLSVEPVRLAAAANVKVSEFDNESGAGSKIRIRINKYRIVDAGYSKWIQTPGELLMRSLNKAFAVNYTTDAPACEIYGTLDTFEVKLDKMQFAISGFYTIRRGKSRLDRQFDISVGLKEKSPVEYARAASAAVNQLGKELAVEINKILKK